jgi:HlyD family secretion protein
MNAFDSYKLAGLVSLLSLLPGCFQSAVESKNIGYVEADWIYVAASTSGQIISQQVFKGDRIEVGDSLFELDRDLELAALAEAESRIVASRADAANAATGARPAEIRALEAKLAQAQARLVQALSEQQRVEPLVERGIETKNRGEQLAANTDIARAAVDSLIEEINIAQLAARDGVRDAANASIITAEASRDIAAARLERRTVIAQVSGRVEELFYHMGEHIAAGRPVLAILPDDGLKIKFFVSQAQLPTLTLGDTVLAQADGLTEPVATIVSFISTAPEFTPPVIYSNEVRQKLVFLVESKVPLGSELLPGLPVDVQWR